MTSLSPETFATDAGAADDFLARLSDPSLRGVPKYLRFQEVLVSAIKDGRWKPGDKLPTEKELAASSRLSVGTVQRALRNLVEQGIVVRQQGLASFVAETQRRLQQPWHTRFLNDDGEVLPVYSKALRRQLTTGRGPWTRYLGNGRIFRIDRRLNIGGEFNVFGRFYADRAALGYFWDCSLDELNGASFRSVVTRECRLPITSLSHNLRLTNFSAEICRSLDVKPDTTGILLYAVARAGRDTVVYYQEFFIPPTSRFLHFSDKPDQSFP